MDIVTAALIKYMEHEIRYPNPDERVHIEIMLNFIKELKKEL